MFNRFHSHCPKTFVYSQLSFFVFCFCFCLYVFFLFISPVILLFNSFVFPSLTRFQYVILQCGEEQGFHFQRVTNNRANLPLELNSCSKLIISFSLRKGITNTIFNNYYQRNQQNLSSIQNGLLIFSQLRSHRLTGAFLIFTMRFSR